MNSNTKKVSQCGAGKLPIPKIFRKGKKEKKKSKKKQSPERPQSFTKFLGEARRGQELLQELKRAGQMYPGALEKLETFVREPSQVSPKSQGSPKPSVSSKQLKRQKVSNSPKGPSKKKRKVVVEPDRKPTLPNKPKLTASKRKKLGPRNGITRHYTDTFSEELRKAFNEFLKAKANGKVPVREPTIKSPSNIRSESSTGSSYYWP